jgi:hypothetical protein
MFPIFELAIQQLFANSYQNQTPTIVYASKRIIKFSKMARICPDDISLCTIETCSLECTQLGFVPSLAGNAAYAVIMGILLLSQIVLGIKYRTWGFMTGMICGLLLEIIGYAGRIMLHHNPFDFNSFLM